MRRIFLFLPFVLGACQSLNLPGSGPGVDVPPGEVRVTRVDATPSSVLIRLSDGTRCISQRPEGTRGTWSGVTSDCGYQLPYTVTYRQSEKAARYQVEAQTTSLGPRAEVFVTDVDGVRRLFVAQLRDDVVFEVPGAEPAAG